MHLCGPSQGDIIAIISLLDLYGPTIYPASLTESEERYNWAKKETEKAVAQPKFFQFFAVHEVEAWLLSQPEIFPLKVRKAFPNKIQNPEKVNFDEPPAKMLQHLYNIQTSRSYKKIVNGKELFDKLDPEIVYKKCPKFKELMDNMLDLARKV
jgi:hypothetical protein